MKMKRFVNVLLSVSLSALSAISLSSCKNNNDILSENLETVTTVSTSAISSSVTETEPQTANKEISEKVSATATELSETTEETTQQTTETTLAETTEQVTKSTEKTTLKTETAAPPETTSAKTEKTTVTEAAAEKLSVEKDGSYTTPEDVAEYIHSFGTLPKNFITKSEAKALGWDNKKGNLWDVAEGKSIGGDYFGNYEGLLPAKKGREYTECDVNYNGGYRGSERIIFSNDGLIYYTNDHYKTFTQLY